MTAQIILKPGKEKPLHLRHPWIFSGAVARVQDAQEGDTIDVLSSKGEFLARGYYNSRSQIVVRVWTFSDEPVDRALIARRLAHAVEARSQLGLQRQGPYTNAFRLVNAESDLLPGLIVDVYGDFLIVQFLTLGIEKRKAEIVAELAELTHPLGIYERSDMDVRAKEGLPESVGVLFGEEPPDRVEVRENGLQFLVDVKRGHKTGFYLDQRDNRAQLGGLLSLPAPSPLEILNAFSYTGAFGVYACAANPAARVLNLDASQDALALAKENFERNAFGARADFLAGDAFQTLRKFRDAARQFDMLILDPPKFVHSKGQLESGCRGYKDLNWLAFRLVRAGGYVVTFSCSGLVSAELFQKVVFEAATDAKRDAQIVARLGQARDHPTLLSFPEGEYLKGLVLKVI